MHERVIDIDLEETADSLYWIGRRRGDESGPGSPYLLPVERHQCKQQIALGGEVVVECSGREFGTFGDLFDAGGREAIAFEQRRRGVENVAPSSGLLSCAQSSHGGRQIEA